MVNISKTNDSPISNTLLNKYDNYPNMVSLVGEDYRYYFKASEQLQKYYPFVIHSIYSCLSRINNYDNTIEAYKELSDFLKAVKERSQLDMQIVRERDSFSVKERPKIKMKKFMRRLAA